MTMEYRKLGRTGLDVGVIGLGTEHLERKQETMERVLHMAVQAGVNYVDLLYVDPEGADAGFWEHFGPALRPCRDSLVLAAHWGVGSPCDMDYCQRCFDGVLARLGNGYAEVGLMTMAIDGKKRWNTWAQESIEHLRRYKEQGRIGAIGASGHNVAIAIKAVNSALLDVLMFGFNMLRHDDKQEKALRQACVEQNVGLVVMKPYHGGTLLSIGGKPSGITPAQCLAYVFSLPVSTAVPGPKNAEEWQATLHYLEASDEEKGYRPVIANMHEILAGQCTYCHHCLPCPQGIEIGWMIWLVDHAQGGVTDDLRNWYAEFRVKPSACVECGECLERCPFDVDIVPKIHEAVELFETGAG